MSWTAQDYLMHHGILGQRWGKKNGPPYPLDDSDHSASEKKAGWKQSLDSNGSKRHGLSDKQKQTLKTSLKIGAGIAVAGLAVYGAYKLNQSGALDNFSAMGKNVVDRLNLQKKTENVGDIADFPKKETAFKSSVRPLDKYDTTATVESINKGRTLHNLPDKEIPKTMDDLFGKLTDDNPLKKPEYMSNNCTNVVLAAAGRLMGKNVLPGWQRDAEGKYTTARPEEIIQCLKYKRDSKGNDVLKSSSRTESFNSYEKTSQVLKNKYPDGSFGYFSSTFLGKTRDNKTGQIVDKEYTHAFLWKIENGVAKFGDGVYGERARDYFSKMVPGHEIHFFRLDDNEFVDEEYRKRVIYE